MKKDLVKVKLIVLAIMMLMSNVANAQRQKPKWDGNGLQCMNCGSYVIKNQPDGWTGKKPGEGKLKVKWGPCPSCGKFWRLIGNGTKDYYVEPVLDERVANRYKSHELEKDCIVEEKAMTGNIKSVRIKNRCSKRKDVYVYLRGKQTKTKDVLYIIKWGDSWLKNIDLEEYESTIMVTHDRNDIPDMTPVGD